MSRKNRTNGVAYFQLLCILIRMTSITAGVLGASGYAGAELLRLLARHPSLRVTWAAGDSSASEPVASRYPGLGHAYGDLAFCTVDEGLSKGAEVLFAALPHGRAAAIAERLGAAAGLVVDLSADFRLHDPAAYPTWYGTPHPHPEELGAWPYGLPELHRDELRGARRVAVPGCYPTAALLALAPLLAAGLVEPDGIVVDAKSGLSGAGRSLSDTYLYVQANENVTPYGVRRRAVRRPAAGRRLAGDQGGRRQQPRPGRRGRPRRSQGGRRKRHRQPRQGGRRTGAAVRQLGPRPARDGRPRARPPGPVTVDRGLGVSAAAGFSAAGVACGVKPAGELDLAVVVGPPGTVAAGAFTTNVVVAAPVVWSRARLAASPAARVVVVNSGNANACTGPAGHRAVRATAERAAAALGCPPEQVLVCSTGVIGVPLDAELVGDGVAKAAANLGRRGGRDAAEAIRTTDTVAKQAGTVLPGGVTVGGMAKGAAMLAPALATAHATMLAVLTTDALADPAALCAGLAAAVEESFNRITVDGAQSTNDTVLLLASS